jgi:hypothetical protein
MTAANTPKPSAATISNKRCTSSTLDATLIRVIFPGCDFTVTGLCPGSRTTTSSANDDSICLSSCSSILLRSTVCALRFLTSFLSAGTPVFTC